MSKKHKTTQPLPWKETMLAKTSRAASRVLTSRASPAIGSISQTRSYHENIVEHYENPRNVGSLDKDDNSVGTVCLFVFIWTQFSRVFEELL